MTTLITFRPPRVHISSAEARTTFETDSFEGPEESTWISSEGSLSSADVGFVDDVLRLVVGRELYGPDVHLSYAWCGTDSDATRVSEVQFALAVPDLEGVFLTAATPCPVGALTARDADSAVDLAVGIYEAVGAQLEDLVRRLTSAA